MSAANRGVLNRFYSTADGDSSRSFTEMEEAVPILMNHSEESFEK